MFKKFLFSCFIILLPHFCFSETFLKKGDIIDIIAPSYGCTADELKKIKTTLSTLGYKPRVSNGLNQPTYLNYSNTADFRLNDLKRALYAKDSKIIWTVRGGYGAQELLNALEQFPKPETKKIFIGYSDATNLHLFLNQKWNWPSLHAITLKFNKNIDPKVNKEESISSLLTFLKAPAFSYPLTALNKPAAKSQHLKSKLIGGNLSIITANMGTFNEIETKDKILLLEDVGETPQRIQRNLLTLKLSGKLDHADALIFGDFTHTNQQLSNRVVKAFSNNLSVPCFKSNLFGHGNKNKPLLLNYPVTLKVENKIATLKSD